MSPGKASRRHRFATEGQTSKRILRPRNAACDDGHGSITNQTSAWMPSRSRRSWMVVHGLAFLSCRPLNSSYVGLVHERRASTHSSSSSSHELGRCNCISNRGMAFGMYTFVPHIVHVFISSPARILFPDIHIPLVLALSSSVRVERLWESLCLHKLDHNAPKNIDIQAYKTFGHEESLQALQVEHIGSLL